MNETAEFEAQSLLVQALLDPQKTTQSNWTKVVYTKWFSQQQHDSTCDALHKVIPNTTNNTVPECSHISLENNFNNKPNGNTNVQMPKLLSELCHEEEIWYGPDLDESSYDSSPAEDIECTLYTKSPQNDDTEISNSEDIIKPPNKDGSSKSSGDISKEVSEITVDLNLSSLDPEIMNEIQLPISPKELKKIEIIIKGIHQNSKCDNYEDRLIERNKDCNPSDLEKAYDALLFKDNCKQHSGEKIVPQSNPFIMTPSHCSLTIDVSSEDGPVIEDVIDKFGDGINTSVHDDDSKESEQNSKLLPNINLKSKEEDLMCSTSKIHLDPQNKAVLENINEHYTIDPPNDIEGPQVIYDDIKKQICPELISVQLDYFSNVGDTDSPLQKPMAPYQCSPPRFLTICSQQQINNPSQKSRASATVALLDMDVSHTMNEHDIQSDQSPILVSTQDNCLIDGHNSFHILDQLLPQYSPSQSQTSSPLQANNFPPVSNSCLTQSIEMEVIDVLDMCDDPSSNAYHGPEITVLNEDCLVNLDKSLINSPAISNENNSESISLSQSPNKTPQLAKNSSQISNVSLLSENTLEFYINAAIDMYDIPSSVNHPTPCTDFVHEDCLTHISNSTLLEYATKESLLQSIPIQSPTKNSQEFTSSSQISVRNSPASSSNLFINATRVQNKNITFNENNKIHAQTQTDMCGLLTVAHQCDCITHVTQEKITSLGDVEMQLLYKAEIARSSRKHLQALSLEYTPSKRCKYDFNIGLDIQLESLKAETVVSPLHLNHRENTEVTPEAHPTLVHTGPDVKSNASFPEEDHQVPNDDTKTFLVKEESEDYEQMQSNDKPFVAREQNRNYYHQVPNNDNNMAGEQNKEDYDQRMPRNVNSIMAEEQNREGYNQHVPSNDINMAGEQNKKGYYQVPKVPSNVNNIMVGEQNKEGYNQCVPSNVNSIIAGEQMKESYDQHVPNHVNSIMAGEQKKEVYNQLLASNVNNIMTGEQNKEGYNQTVPSSVNSIMAGEQIKEDYDQHVPSNDNNMAGEQNKQGYNQCVPNNVNSIMSGEQNKEGYDQFLTSNVNNIMAGEQKKGSYDQCVPSNVNNITAEQNKEGYDHRVLSNVNSITSGEQNKADSDHHVPSSDNSIIAGEQIKEGYDQCVQSNVNSITAGEKNKEGYDQLQPSNVNIMAGEQNKEGYDNQVPSNNNMVGEQNKEGYDQCVPNNVNSITAGEQNKADYNHQVMPSKPLMVGEQNKENCSSNNVIQTDPKYNSLFEWGLKCSPMRSNDLMQDPTPHEEIMTGHDTNTNHPQKYIERPRRIGLSKRAPLKSLHLVNNIR